MLAQPTKFVSNASLSMTKLEMISNRSDRFKY
jgi:hypothetical protein